MNLKVDLLIDCVKRLTNNIHRIDKSFNKHRFDTYRSFEQCYDEIRELKEEIKKLKEAK